MYNIGVNRKGNDIMKNFIYYAIQLPCSPKFDYNVGFHNKDRILDAMRSNYGREFHFEDRGIDLYGAPITYVISAEGEDYARVVCITVVD